MMIRNRLSELMGKRRLKMSDVARRSGLSYTSVHAIYHNHVQFIAFKTLDRLCQALTCQVGDLLEYVPHPSQDGTG
ncbi:MAG: helix-turn-helix transcriptional regulator [Candidatus Latescibacteria bacterium]|nr:helix-turn-helix transcriptional regulator [Candidatus Latescibacterota bacterium]